MQASFSMRYLVALLFVCPISAHAGWFSYDSFEDCLLDKMKGQNDSARWDAIKVCSKALKREENIGVNYRKFNWSTSRNRVTITPETPDDEYLLTRAQFSFSPKPCANSKAEDFGLPIDFVFTNDEASKSLLQEPVCMKPLDAWGKYK